MLIVLEGLDGAGKTTQVKLLQNYFKLQGKSVEYLHFPRFDAPVFGEMIAAFLRGEFGILDSVHPHLVALLFAEDRNDAADIIYRWLNEGRVVLLDRYVYSNIAFQCAKLATEQQREYLRNKILEMEYEHFGIPKPDVNIFLDVPLSVTKKRLEDSRKGEDRKYLKGKEDIHETDHLFQEKVREVYLKQVRLDPTFIRVDCLGSNGSKEAESISTEIIEIICKHNHK